MAARKKSRRKSLIDSIEKELKDLSKHVERRLAPLRKEVDKAERKAGTGTAKLLRQARARLNEVQISGDSELKKFLRQRKRQLSKGLTETEKVVRPKRKKKASRKSPARKKSGRGKKTGRRRKKAR